MTRERHATDSTSTHSNIPLGSNSKPGSTFNVVPLALRDRVHNVIVRYRYRLRGERPIGYRPPEEIKERFRHDVE
ncbi:MAG: hypothetical protein E4H32_05260 [Nitrospirales bacterium]|jgi:predicted DCC family thiol-disulfide oxidoreductase YuxK|nr:MAG: hypothetical protein E4H32_05260 [Nitrospirales bacterium]